MPGCGGHNSINALTKTMNVSQLELWVVWLDTKPTEYNKDFQNKYLNYFFSLKKYFHLLISKVEEVKK